MISRIGPEGLAELRSLLDQVYEKACSGEVSTVYVFQCQLIDPDKLKRARYLRLEGIKPGELDAEFLMAAIRAATEEYDDRLTRIVPASH